MDSAHMDLSVFPDAYYDRNVEEVVDEGVQYGPGNLGTWRKSVLALKQA